MNHSTRNKLINFSLLFFLAVLSIVVALYNRYPLVASDTGAYIATGKQLVALTDRPSMYGFFIVQTSLKATLWLPILAQGFICVYLMFLICRIFFPQKANLVIIFLVLFLSANTAYSIHAGQLLPDIFAAVMILCIVYLIMAFDKRNVHSYVVIFFLLIAITSHNSHFLISIAFTFLFSISIFIFKVRNAYWQKVVLLLGIVIGSFLFNSSINYILGGSFGLPSNNVFLVGRMSENGTLDMILDDQCNKQYYEMCSYRDSIPNSCQSFIWDPASPANTRKWWEKPIPEYSSIVKESLTNFKYVFKQVKEIIKSGVSQFFNYESGDGCEGYQANSSPYVHVKKYYPKEIKAYINTDQFANKLNFDYLKEREQIVMMFSLLFFGYLLFLYCKPDERGNLQPLLITAVIVFTLVFLNAMICGGLSGVFPRYQSRVMWLLPMTTTIGVLYLIKNRPVSGDAK